MQGDAVVVLAQSQGQFEETLFALQRLAPRVLAFVAIVIVGYLVARVLARLADTALKRLGFERAVQIGGVKDALARSGYEPADLLAKVVFYGLMLLVLQLAFGVFGPNPVSTLLNGVIAFVPRLFVATVIVVVAAAIAAVLRDVVASLIGSLSYGRLLALCAYGLVLGVGVFAALNQLQVAPAIVNGLFYALLAIIVGVTVVAVGGGGIAPMRQRWEHALRRMDDEAVRIREAAQEGRERREAAERAERERQVELERQQELERQEELAREEELERERQEELARQQWVEHEALEEEQHLEPEREEEQQRVTLETGYPEPADVDTEPPADEPPRDERYAQTEEHQFPRPDDRRRLRAARRSATERERPPIRYRGSDFERTGRTYDELQDEQTQPVVDDEIEPTELDETQTINREDVAEADLDETQASDPGDTQVIEPRRRDRRDG
jgi:hypothetical protein